MRPVILAGGSEVVAVALAEEFLEAGIAFAVISLGGGSLLRDSVSDMLYAELPWPPQTDVRHSGAALRNQLVVWGATGQEPWPIFPTEDGGLRLLLECRASMQDVARFSYARRLDRHGGLDKSELFSFLSATECRDVIAPTMLLDSLAELDRVLDRLGDDCVIKPALKPFSMRLAGMHAKAFMSRDYPDRLALAAALGQAWVNSDHWVVQSRLTTPARGEVVYWAVRDSHGGMTGITAVEKWKQPRSGGTGCWVETDSAFIEVLLPIAGKILDELDFVGICEMEFLLDEHARWRLLELNPRPWLQVGLARVAGAPLARMALAVLLGGRVNRVVAREGASWINIERLLLAAGSSEQGPRARALWRAGRALLRADMLAMYGTNLSKVRGRWLRRMVRIAWARLC